MILIGFTPFSERKPCKSAAIALNVCPPKRTMLSAATEADVKNKKVKNMINLNTTLKILQKLFCWTCFKSLVRI
jgi:hypothetical protein